MRKQLTPANVFASVGEADVTFLAKLRELNAHAEATRDALIVLQSSAPKDEAEWLAAMTDPDVAKELGFLFLLAAKNTSWVNSTVTFILGTVAEKAPGSVAALQESFAAGQVRAEMSCSCGQCIGCLARGEVGEETAAKRLTEQFLPPKPTSRLVDVRGNKLH